MVRSLESPGNGADVAMRGQREEKDHDVDG